MFNCLVCENIFYGCFDVIDDEIFVVVCVVEVYDFILMFQDYVGCIGYDVYLGECGVKLLGG